MGRETPSENKTMASKLKSFSDFIRYHAMCKERLRLARQGDEEALEFIRQDVDTIILRVFDSGNPFWIDRPSEFDADQLDKENVMSDDARVMDVYERSLAVVDEIHRQKGLASEEP